jgi:hypothetical protein
MLRVRVQSALILLANLAMQMIVKVQTVCTVLRTLPSRMTLQAVNTVVLRESTPME